MKTTDVHPRHARPINDAVIYSTMDRYTLQYLKESPSTMVLFPNNTDASFGKRTKKPKPSAILLHYNYGAAALLAWGKCIEPITERENIPRPALRPSQTKFDHENFQKKRAGSREPAEPKSSRKKSDQDAEREELAHETMLFYWANSPVATKRRAREERERNERITSWRMKSGLGDGVDSNPRLTAKSGKDESETKMFAAESDES